MSHPDPEELVRHLGAPDPAIATHVAACPACAADLDRLRAAVGLLGVLGGRRAPASACLEDDVVAALAEGSLPEPGRAEALAHLATCAACRSAVSGVVRALADPAVAEAIPRPARRQPRARWLVAAAAAVLALAVLVRGTGDGPLEPTHRAPAITDAERPATIAPVGAVPRPAMLRWGTVPGADLYRVTLLDADGSVLLAAELRDTIVALPDSLELMPGRTHAWMVEARIAWGRWTEAAMAEFTVRAEPVP